jgi:hypothetical protein
VILRVFVSDFDFASALQRALGGRDNPLERREFTAAHLDKLKIVRPMTPDFCRAMLRLVHAAQSLVRAFITSGSGDISHRSEFKSRQYDAGAKL